MSEPAFARPATYSPKGEFTSYSQEGISQRRLLAGMILGHAVGGILTNPPKEDPTVETIRTIVRASIIFADELIKQTEV